MCSFPAWFPLFLLRLCQPVPVSSSGLPRCLNVASWTPTDYDRENNRKRGGKWKGKCGVFFSLSTQSDACKYLSGLDVWEDLLILRQLCRSDAVHQRVVLNETPGHDCGGFLLFFLSSFFCLTAQIFPPSAQQWLYFLTNYRLCRTLTLMQMYSKK